MVSDDEREIVATADDRGLRILNRERPIRRWISAKKWIKLEEAR